MDRKAWLLLAPAVALIGVGAYVWWADEPPTSTPPTQGASAGFEEPEVLDNPGVPPVLGAPVDAGPTAAARPVTSAQEPVGDPIAPPGEAPDEPRSPAVPDVGTHGFQVGVARRRVELLESRIARMRERVEALEEENPALAARQRAVLERIEGRLGEVREEQSRLTEAARADGTLGDEQQGYDAEDTRGPGEEGPAQARLPSGSP